MTRYLFNAFFLMALSAILSCVVFTSCSSPTLVERFASLEEYCEGVDSFSSEEMGYVVDEYRQLVSEFTETIDSYSDAEKEEIYGYAGRIGGIITRHTADKSVKAILEGLGALPSLLDGFKSAFDLDGLLKSLGEAAGVEKGE